MMKKSLKILGKAVKIFFIVFCLFILSLFFREQRLPDALSSSVLDSIAPTNFVIHADSISFGFRHGLHVRALRVYDAAGVANLKPVVSADSISLSFVPSRVVVEGLTYARLPESYYAPGNQERNQPVDSRFPNIGSFDLTLIRPDILGIAPERVRAEVVLRSDRLSFNAIRLNWRDAEERMTLNGNCTLDIHEQRLFGRVEGFAKQYGIRPLLVALDIPVALPYMDGFTDVPGKVPASCEWDVDLVNNDTDIKLSLPSVQGKYNSVPFSSARGDLRFHIFTRGTCLNYRHAIGPIDMVDPFGRELHGTILVEGSQGTNTVSIAAQSGCRIQDILRIVGFEENYVDEKIIGESSGEFVFTFPRAMTNNYEVLQGRGSLSVKNGQIMRLRGFEGLLSILADKVPGVSWFTDSTQASCSYTIENGLLKSDDIYIEGPVFSIKMYGGYDIVHDQLDFIARVQFVKNDSFLGKVVHSITWPFTKLLLEFRLTGSADDPQWDYLSIVDRVLEVGR